MSSMRGVALILLLVTSTAASTQVPYALRLSGTAAGLCRPAAGYGVGYALNDWRRLRQNSGYSFADYARFLIANPGWPSEESELRGWAERAMRPGENAGDRPLLLLQRSSPQTGNGFARLADALSATGRAPRR